MDGLAEARRGIEGHDVQSLCEMNRRGILDLPAPGVYGFEKQVPGVDINVVEISCSFEELGEIRIEPVKGGTRESKEWFSMMDRFHYLKGGPLCGSQIRYVIISEKYGSYLGGLGFASGTFALKDRDEYIGWSERARRSNLELVVNNVRFLILPTAIRDSGGLRFNGADGGSLSFFSE
jgi:hypothetical protein